MKEIIEIKNIEPNTLIIYGQPKTCIPCKMTDENLYEIENEKKFDLTYLCCSDILSITNKGYKSVPIIELVTSSKISILTDTSVMMDKDELIEWIGHNME